MDDRESARWTSVGSTGQGTTTCDDKERQQRDSHGGLGIIDLRDMNLALLGKWWWKVFHPNGEGWQQFVQGYLCGNGTRNLGFRVGPRVSHFWKGIAKAHGPFNSCVKSVIGNGRLTRFWWDQWCADHSLSSLFPDLYAQASRPHCTVATAWKRGAWNPAFKQPLDAASLRRLTELKAFITSSGASCSQGPDKLAWDMEQDGKFSVRSLYNRVHFRGCTPNWSNVVWKTKAPLKIKVFIWLVLNDAILTRENLSKRQPNLDVQCGFCHLNVETRDHLFLHCHRSKAVVTEVLNALGASHYPHSYEDLWVGPLFATERRAMREAWFLAIAAMTWVLWLDRNNLYFRNTCNSISGNLTHIMHLISFWANVAAAGPRGRIATVFQVQDFDDDEIEMGPTID